MIELVWLVERDDMFEKDWIEFLFKDIPHVSITDTDPDVKYKCPIFIFNASVPYEQYLSDFGEERIPFGVLHLSDETLGNTCDYLESYSCIFAIRNYHHPVFSVHPKVITIGLGYKSKFTEVATGMRSQNPWYHWCFIGAVHHQARQDAIRAFLPCKPYLLQISSGGFNSENLTLEDYKTTMILSKFAICPIGQGNLDTFRFYEAMEAGCVPVVLKRTPEQPYHPSYWHAIFQAPSSVELPIVMGDSWQDCLQTMENLMQNPTKYYDLQTKMNFLWDAQKTAWKQMIQQKAEQLKFACSQ